MGSSFIVEIKDFQSLKSVRLALEDGVNIITGRTNQGKSAVIRAIDSALFNMGDDDMVRGGKRYSAVSLNNSRHNLVFCRDNKGKNEKTAYQFDGGDVQKKVGRGQLPEVAKMFNIRDVRMQNNTKMKLNFWYQNDKPFLMDKTSGQLYEFLSLSSCDSYTKILKKMVVDMKVLEADVNNITTEMDTLKVINNRKRKFVESNDGYDAVYHRVITANQEENRLKTIRETVGRIIECKKKMDDSRTRLQKLDNLMGEIPMKELSDQHTALVHDDLIQVNTHRVLTRVADLSTGIATKKQKIQKGSEVLEGSDDVIHWVQEEFKVAEQRAREVLEIQKALTVLDAKRVNLSTVHERMEALRSTGTEDISYLPASLAEVERLELLCGKLGKIFTKVDSIQSRVSTALSELSGSELRIKELEGQLEVLKKSAGYCPFCSTVFHDGECE